MQRDSDPSSGASPSEFAEAEVAGFVREMAERYLSRQSNVFLLSGNVADLVDGLGVAVPAQAVRDRERYCYMERYLAKRLESRGRFVLTYNIARGINFTSADQSKRLRAFYARYDSAAQIDDDREQDRRAQKFDRCIVESKVYSFLTLKFLEELCTLARRHPQGGLNNLTVIIKHAETLLPDAALPQMADIDRQKLTLLREWFSDPDFLGSNEQVMLISPTSVGVHRDLRTLPHVSSITIPLPDKEQRAAFIEWMGEQTGGSVKLKKSGQELAVLTAGMTYLTLQNLFLQARHRGGELDERDVLEALNQLLVSELGDKVEMVVPQHTMGDVVGATELRRELGRLKALMALRDPKLCPVGILVTGPNGVGKTFIFEAWAAECDRLVIVLKNLRSMYFGQTDQIFEKLRHVLEALGNVIVLIDEADTVFAKPGGANVHETEARLFGNIIRMMGDPRNRGRIVWLLLTARPDNLAPDLKRSGRAGLHLPVFDPEGEDRRAYIDHTLGRGGFDPSGLTATQRAELEQRTLELSPADFNEVVMELRAERAMSGSLTYEQVLSVLDNILPGQIAAQRRVQSLNAFLECSRRTLIPPSLRELDRGAAEAELEELKRKLTR